MIDQKIKDWIRKEAIKDPSRGLQFQHDDSIYPGQSLFLYLLDEVELLENRQKEHLQLINNLSRNEANSDELENCRSRCAVLIAKVGTLTAEMKLKEL